MTKTTERLEFPSSGDPELCLNLLFDGVATAAVLGMTMKLEVGIVQGLPVTFAVLIDCETDADRVHIESCRRMITSKIAMMRPASATVN